MALKGVTEGAALIEGDDGVEGNDGVEGGGGNGIESSNSVGCIEGGRSVKDVGGDDGIEGVVGEEKPKTCNLFLVSLPQTIFVSIPSPLTGEIKAIGLESDSKVD